MTADDLTALLERVAKTPPAWFTGYGIVVADDPLVTLLNVVDRLADIAAGGDATEVARVGTVLLGKRWGTVVDPRWPALERLRHNLAPL